MWSLGVLCVREVGGAGRVNNLLVYADVDKILVGCCVCSAGCCAVFVAGTLLEQRACRYAAVRVVERVEIRTNVGGELGRVYAPVDDFGVGVSEGAGGSDRC